MDRPNAPTRKIDSYLVALFIFLILLASTASFAQKSPPANTHEPHSAKQEINAPHSAETSGSVIQSAGDQNRPTAKRNESARAIRVLSLPPRSVGDYIALVCTVILTLVGVGGVFIAIGTLSKIKVQAIETARSAKAAADSVEAINRQAGIMERQFSISHRPWVTVSGGIKTNGPLVFDNSGAHVSISYLVRNGGIAPAIGTLTMMSALFVGPMPRTPDEARRAIGCGNNSAGLSGNSIGVLILPNDAYEVSNFPLHTQQGQPVNYTEPQEVWFTICIRYTDELGNPHGTGLLWRFDSSGGERSILPKGAVQGQFTQIGFGNESF